MTSSGGPRRSPRSSDVLSLAADPDLTDEQRKEAAEYKVLADGFLKLAEAAAAPPPPPPAPPAPAPPAVPAPPAGRLRSRLRPDGHHRDAARHDPAGDAALDSQPDPAARSRHGGNHHHENRRHRARHDCPEHGEFLRSADPRCHEELAVSTGAARWAAGSVQETDSHHIPIRGQAAASNAGREPVPTRGLVDCAAVPSRPIAWTLALLTLCAACRQTESDPPPAARPSVELPSDTEMVPGLIHGGETLGSLLRSQGVAGTRSRPCWRRSKACSMPGACAMGSRGGWNGPTPATPARSSTRSTAGACCGIAPAGRDSTEFAAEVDPLRHQDDHDAGVGTSGCERRLRSLRRWRSRRAAGPQRRAGRHLLW